MPTMARNSRLRPALRSPSISIRSPGSSSRAIVSPKVGDLAISEWMADPAAAPDADGEWIEVRASADGIVSVLALAS